LIKIEAKDAKDLGLILFKLSLIDAEIAEAVNRAAFKLSLKEEGKNI
tara:strand:+ start:1039 stop:1179 length:141 start_codon:yes stop_codon:yes gene_type:complete